jgi:hypothetical protein
MRAFFRSVMLCGVAGVVFAACADSGRTPTSPSATLAAPEQMLQWDCGRQAVNQAVVGGWSFQQPSSTCGASLAASAVVGSGEVTFAPANLRATVTGTTVRLDWDPVLEAVVSHRIEAGSAPSLANLAILNTGTTSTTLTVNGVPSGVYYVRVRAVGPDNIAGPASNEIVVRVGACSAAPGAPSNLSATVPGNTVNLTWNASGGDAPSSYIVEAGSAPGAANVVVFDTGTAATALTAVAPNGVYYVRIRGRNACGIGAASNEFIVRVPNGGGGTTPPPATETPWTPPPVPDPPGPPPPVRALVPEVTASVPLAAPPAVVVGPAPRPDRAAGPAVEVAAVSSPTSTTRRLRVTSSRPVDQIILAGDTRVAAQSLGRVETMAAAESFYLIRLASAQTVVELTLTVAQSFTAQITARLGDTGPAGEYKAQTLISTLGGGAFRATLTWDTTADIDLHVIEPNSTHVYFGNTSGTTASLDVDDVNGFGPENIFVPSGRAAAGIYQVYINHFSGPFPTTSTVTITVGGNSRTFTRTTTSGQRTLNVANVNALTGEITEVATARIETNADAITVPKRTTPQ